jgi:putative addiction module killer protein
MIHLGGASLIPIQREIHYFQTNQGKSPYLAWFNGLRDGKTKSIVRVRVIRLETGNFGDCHPVGDGILELRIHFGPGLRIYFGVVNQQVVLLLCGGDKSSQARDIQKAKLYWADYRRRINETK